MCVCVCVTHVRTVDSRSNSSQSRLRRSKAYFAGLKRDKRTCLIKPNMEHVYFTKRVFTSEVMMP